MIYHTAEPHIAFVPNARSLRGLKGDAPKRYAELQKQLAEFDSIKPADLEQGQFMRDISATAPPTYVLKGGNPENKGEEVQPGFLWILTRAMRKLHPRRTENLLAAAAHWLRGSRIRRTLCRHA